MTQTAQVQKLLANHMAQIAVVRQGACGHNCGECGGCASGQMPTVTALADNAIGAAQGDVVTVETASGQLLGIMAFVYLLPMVFLILGYALGMALGWGEVGAIAAGGVCFLVSIGLTILLDRHIRKKRSLDFRIVAVVGR